MYHAHFKDAGKDTGAFGTFVVTNCMSGYTTADFLQKEGAQTKTLVRFSTVIRGHGFTDTVRNMRGFATKFYTNQGIYDILGSSLPVFPTRDAIKFSDLIHSLNPAPNSAIADEEHFWDFASLSPETTHMITWLYSDKGTVKDYRHMDFFGPNAHVWVNKDKACHYVKYHWKTMQGIKTLDRHEAQRLHETDPDAAARLLYEAIEYGDFPKYELKVQLITIEQANALRFDPLDDTKIWPEDEFPLMNVGIMTLNKNPENFFPQIETAAFSLWNVVPGIAVSVDKMFQYRTFPYSDAHRHNFGPILSQSPVNRMDDFTQAGERYRSLSEEERDHLHDNIAAELFKYNEDVKWKVLSHFERADPHFADGTRRDLELYKRGIKHP